MLATKTINNRLKNYAHVRHADLSNVINKTKPGPVLAEHRFGNIWLPIQDGSGQWEELASL